MTAHDVRAVEHPGGWGWVCKCGRTSEAFHRSPGHAVGNGRRHIDARSLSVPGVIHRATPHPNGLGALPWVTDRRGVRAWILYLGPGWGYELLDDDGRTIDDGFIYLDDVRRWARS